MLDDAVRELEGATLSQLRMIVQHEAAYELFLHDTSTVRQMSKRADAIEQALLDSEQTTHAARAELQGLKAEADALEQIVAENLAALHEAQARRDETLAQLNARRIREKMDAAAAQQEALSEAALASFLDGKVKPDEFLAKYTNHRKAFHSSQRKCSDGGDVAAHLVSVVRG